MNTCWALNVKIRGEIVIVSLHFWINAGLCNVKFRGFKVFCGLFGFYSIAFVFINGFLSVSDILFFTLNFNPVDIIFRASISNFLHFPNLMFFPHNCVQNYSRKAKPKMIIQDYWSLDVQILDWLRAHHGSNSWCTKL